MKLAMNAFTFGPKVSVLDKIRATAEAGFDGIELVIQELYEHVGLGGEISEVEAALAETGLEVPCCLGLRNWGDLEGWDYQLVLGEARRRMQLARRLGSPLLVCSTPMYREDTAGLHTRYRDLLEIGRETGCRPIFEFIGFYKSITTLPQAMEMLRKTNHPDAGLCLDAFHNWNGGSSLDDLRACPLEWMAHYHIDDARPDVPQSQQVDTDRVLPGEGQIGIAAELQVLREKGYEGWVSLELFNAELWATGPQNVARRGIESVRRFLPS